MATTVEMGAEGWMDLAEQRGGALDRARLRIEALGHDLDERTRERDELMEWRADVERSHREVVEGRCGAGDERHCSCVTALRRELEAQRGTAGARFLHLMRQLHDRFPDPEPFRSDEMPEVRALAAVDGLLKNNADQATCIEAAAEDLALYDALNAVALDCRIVVAALERAHRPHCREPEGSCPMLVLRPARPPAGAGLMVTRQRHVKVSVDRDGAVVLRVTDEEGLTRLLQPGDTLTLQSDISGDGLGKIAEMKLVVEFTGKGD